MQVICPGCRKKYTVDESRLEQARKQRPKCKACGADIFPDEKKKEKGDGKTVVMQSPRRAGEKGASEPAPDREHPERLGNFRILEVIGTGGMGIVYKGLDESLHRHVAIKTLSRDLCSDENYRSRFLVEARALARLVHPNITQIYSAGEDGDLLYFVMEYVDGPSTDHLLKTEKTIETMKAVNIASQVAKGLEKALQLGIIHRDIKPGNILLSRDGSVKITDFGLAKLASEDQALTQTGLMLGTPSYISPEQAQCEKVDFRSDIYSLGATLYHFVLGEPPFKADSAVTLVMKHINESVRFPVQVTSRAIPPLLTGILRRMMSKSPDERYQSYSHLIQELERFEKGLEKKDEPEPATSTPSRRPLPAKKNSGPLSKALVFSVIALLAMGGYMMFSGRDGEDRLQQTQRETSPPTLTDALTMGALPDAREDEYTEETGGADTNTVILSLTENTYEELEEGNYRFYGTIVNMWEESIDGIRVEVTLLDVFEDTLEKQDIQIEPNVVMPGESARYSLLIKDTERRFDNYSIRLWDTNDPDLDLQVDMPEGQAEGINR